MPTYVNDNGTWREINESLSVHDGGSYREIDEAYVNDNGTWRLVYESEKPMILSSTFKIGGQKYGSAGNTGTDNVGFAGYGAGDLFILNAGLVPGTMFGRFSTDFRLLSTASQWQEIQTTNFTTGGSNSSYANTVIGITPSQLFYTINSSSYPNYYRAQPDAANSSGSPTGGSITTATYNTASTANGTTNTQGASHTLKQIFTPGQSGREDYNRVYAVVDASVNSSVFPGEALTLTTQDYYVGASLIPGQTFTMRFNLTESTISLPAQGRSSSPLAKAIRTTSQVRRDNGDLVPNLYNRLFGQTFSGTYFSLNPTIEIYDRVNLPFKSSSGGVEYRRVMSLMWQYQDVPISGGNPKTNSQIWFAVEGHGLPTNAWRRMEINGVSLDASLFSKSEVAANGSITPAYTLWMYVYPNEPVSAFGTVGSTINVNIYK